MEIITAKGINGEVDFDGQFVTIRRKGGLARMSMGKGEKRIPLASITAVQWKEPGVLVNGFIQFTLAGGIEQRSRFGQQTQDAAHDENSIVVTKKQAPDFLALRTAIESGIATQLHAPVAAPVAATGAAEVSRLAELHAQGILTDEEFAAAKARALGL